jgi:predicted ATPase/class 3 adenylate cyclase
MSAMLPPGSAPALPTGTVTFAFTDIEGSTRRWERDRAAMERALKKHDALLRETISRHGGHVFKTVGDAFCAAFARPEDAVAAMLDAQHALGAEDFSAVDGLHIRAAIHTGTADERDGDYFGVAVNRVARLLGIGHGGQVLLSGVTADIVQGALPARASLRDLGEHRLRDLARPEYVYQLIGPDLRADFPPLRSLESHLNNLPLQLKSFVGREHEIAEITALLGTHRLVTLVGSGGVGKTRTSLQVAANFLDESADGVWFVELAPLADGSFVPAAISQMVGIALPVDGDPLVNLARALKSKRMLIVFDNCEHMVDAAARIVSAISRDCPSVKMLASSRQVLGIEGEESYRLPSLDVPPENETEGLSAREAMRSAAVSLFVERARAADKRFGLSDKNATVVADICRRLDGIPLAIELAAARVKLLSPTQLLQRLDERFRVLTGGSRDALPRQQTLRATIDWSYELLDDTERALFRSLGVFVNGFTFEGAAALVGGDDENAALDTLASLVDKSLVIVEADGEALSYRLLESTRFYAREKLDVTGERAEFERRHLVYLRDLFVEARDVAERTARASEIEDLFAREFEDVRAAVDNALHGSDTIVGAELVAAIGSACQTVGYRDSIGRAGALIAALPDAPAGLLARLWAVVSVGTGNMVEALDAIARANTYAHESGDAALVAEILTHYARRAAKRRDIELATAALDEAGTIACASAASRLGLREARAFVALFAGDNATASSAYEGLRNEHRALGNTSEFCRATVNLAECENAAGHVRRAAALLEDALPRMERGRNRQFRAIALQNHAGYQIALGDLGTARTSAREAIRELAPFAPDAIVVANSMEHLALTFALEGDAERAAALAGYADEALRKSKFIREFTEVVTRERILALLRERLDPGVLARKLDEGAALEPEVAMALALQPP